MERYYCPVCGYSTFLSNKKCRCRYCKAHYNIANETEEELSRKIDVNFDKIEQFVFEKYVKDNPQFNPKKREKMLLPKEAEEKADEEEMNDPHLRAEFEKQRRIDNEILTGKPTCPKCGGHDITAVSEGAFFSVTYRVCLKCGHKY